MRKQGTLHRTALVVALLLAVAVAALGAVSVARKVASFQPLGFEARAEGGFWQVTAVADPATGLEPGDRIVLVGGDQAAGNTELERILRRRPETALTVLRDGAPRQVAYRLPPLDVDASYVLIALVGLGYLLIGSYTLLRDQRRPARLFYLWCLASALLYLASAQGPFDLVDRGISLADELARLVLPPLTLHLFLVFPTPLATRWGRRAIPFLYLPAAVLLVLLGDLALFSGRLVAGPPSAASIALLDRLQLLHLVIFALAAVAVLVLRLRRTRPGEARRQAAWLAVGLAAGYLPFILLYALPFVAGFRWPELIEALTVAPLAVVPITFAYAILRYKLWDIEVLVRHTVSVTLTALIGVLGFSLANVTVNRLVPDHLALGRNLLVFASGLTIAGVLIPTRRKIGGALERLQYGSTFGRRRALLHFGRQLLEERSLDRLCDKLLQHLESALDLERVNMYLADGEALSPVRPRRGLPVRLEVGDLPGDLWRSDLRSLAPPALPQVDATPLQLLHASGYRYAFPLEVRNQPVGLVLTSHKAGGVPLSSDDTDLVRNLLNQAALGIENAKLLDQVHQQLDEVMRLQEFSQSIIESSPAGIAVLDAGAHVLSSNLGFAALLGRERQAVIGRALGDLLPVEALPEAGGGIAEVELESPHGERRHLQVSRARLDAEDEAAQQVLVVQDVSDRVAMERALKEKERLAALGMLAAGVAHEVNTPITGISSYAQMLLAETPQGDPRREMLEKVERQTFRAARIVNNLLDFARQRSDELAPVDLSSVLDECASLLAERMDDRRIDLVWEPPAEAPRVLGCEGELQQVFTNLILNAIDAMGAGGGTLRLGLEADAATARATVEDDGPGIPPEELERIFQPFYSTKLGRGGTGLGLSISYNIVDHHNGEIRVDSRPGRGTRFTVELPRHDEEDAPESRP